jgi:hypothetical protein
MLPTSILMCHEFDFKVVGDSQKMQMKILEGLKSKIIRNLQIKIENLHIRFEGKTSKPFAVGITLKSLNLSTTDNNWDPSVIRENIPTINKVQNDSHSLIMI